MVALNPAFMGLFLYLAIGAWLVSLKSKDHLLRNEMFFFGGSIILFYLVAFIIHAVGVFE